MARVVEGKVLRTCNVCQITEDLIDFYRKKSQGVVYTLNVCKPCMADIQAEYFARWWRRNKEERIIKIRAWQKNNVDKVRAMWKRTDEKRRRERLRYC